MDAPSPARRWGRIALLTLPLLGCGIETPQERVRALLDRAESSIERRDPAVVYTLLCESFTDQSGTTGEDTLHAITRYLLLHRPIYAVTRIVGIDVATRGESSAELYAAFSGQPMDTAADLPRVDTEVLHLRLVLVNDEDGRLCVRQATWVPATESDMLLGRRLPTPPATAPVL